METDRDGAGDIVYAPSSALPNAHTYTELGHFTVDGEAFTARRTEDGSIHYDWISEPNDGYGFSVFCGPGPLSPERHGADIREFLSAVDPATGYFYDT